MSASEYGYDMSVVTSVAIGLGAAYRHFTLNAVAQNYITKNTLMNKNY